MRLVTGPAGSGKTSLVLEGLREAAGRSNTAVRLLVPTATMALHLQNRLARDGLVFRPGLIQTLSRFVDDWVEAVPQVPETVLRLMVEAAAARVNRAEFAQVADLPGFIDSLARAIGDFSSAGCDSARLEHSLPETPLGPAFLAIYREVERELKRRGMAMRATRLQLAARRIEAEGAGGLKTIWLDGFYALPDPELAVVGALANRAEVTVTLPASPATEPTRDRLLAIGFSETCLARRRPAPATVLVTAASREREADEIARRILEQSRAGRPFREIGIVVRSPETYAPLLRATLERFGIAARFYFDGRLDANPAIRCLAGAVDGMLEGWDHEAILAVLRLAPRTSSLLATDRFDFRVREQVPNRGLHRLRELLRLESNQPLSSAAERIAGMLDRLALLEEWRPLVLDSSEWVLRFRTLRDLFSPARPAEPADHELALAWRSQVEALDLFDQSLDEAALAAEPNGPVALPVWWRAVKSVLRLTPLRTVDRRRNVVHVFDAHEARQWELPVVFVCGLVEKQFPRFHRQDPFFPDAARAAQG